MQTFLAQLRNVLWNIFNRPTIADILDILIVAFLIYKLLMLTRETRASAVLKGLVTLLLASWISDLLGLTALNWVSVPLWGSALCGLALIALAAWIIIRRPKYAHPPMKGPDGLIAAAALAAMAASYLI